MARRNLPLPADDAVALLLSEGRDEFPEQANYLIPFNYASVPLPKDITNIMDVANHNFFSMEVEGNDFGRLRVLRYLVHELNMDINKTDIDQVFLELGISRSAAPALPTFSKMDMKAVDELRRSLEHIGKTYFRAIFEVSVKIIDTSQVSRENSYEQYLGVPKRQTVSDTCTIVATTVCVETLHRLVYERKHGNGTFPFVLAAPRKLPS